MPYADPQKQREAQAAWYRRKYAEKDFAEAESDRKKAWLQTEDGKTSNAAASKRVRQKRKAETTFVMRRWLIAA